MVRGKIVDGWGEGVRGKMEDVRVVGEVVRGKMKDVRVVING